MTYYPDLSRCDYLDREEWGALDLVAVGWLEDGVPFPRGAVAPGLVEHLFDLLETVWDPVLFRGYHQCELGDHENLVTSMRDGQGRRVSVGATNLLVPDLAGERLFVTPSLVLHYIVDHDYCPPEPFQAALMACPRTDDVEYFRRVEPVTPAEWREGPFAHDYQERLGGALARRAGAMDQHAWRRLASQWDTYGTTRPLPPWFERKHLDPIRSLADELASRGEATDAEAVRVWLASLVRDAKHTRLPELEPA